MKSTIIKVVVATAATAATAMIAKKVFWKKDSFFMQTLKQDEEVSALVKQLAEITNTPAELIYKSLEEMKDAFEGPELRSAVIAGLQTRLYFEQQKQTIISDMRDRQQEATERVMEMTEKLVADMLEGLE